MNLAVLLALGLVAIGNAVVSSPPLGPAPLAHPTTPAPMPLATECPGDCIFVQVPNECPDNCIAIEASCLKTSLDDCDGCAVQLNYTVVCDLGTVAGELNHLGNCQSATNRIEVNCPSDPSIRLAVMEAVCLQCN